MLGYNFVNKDHKVATHVYNFGNNPDFSGGITAAANTATSGPGLFKYTPPTDFKLLQQDNFPDEGVKPDLVWIKGRDATRVPIISDSVRGITYYIIPSITNGETNISGGVADNLVKSTSTTGFTIGSDSAVNVSSEKFVAWCWKAGGAPASDGVAMVNGTATTTAALKTSASASITPTRMSVNTKTSFSIVKYTSPNNSSDQTVPHGLSSAPNWIIVKNLDNTYNWDIYHSSVSNSGIFTNAAINSRTAFGTVTVSYTHLTLPTNREV